MLKLLLGMVLAAGTFYIISPNFDAPVMSLDPYQFQVYCPINKVPPNLLQDDPVKNYFQSKTNEDFNFLTSELVDWATLDDGIDKYVVWAQMRRVDDSSNQANT